MRTSTQQTEGFDGLVYWALVVLGVGGLALCVLMPEWRELEALQAVESAHRARVEELRAAVECDERLLHALQGDPAVLARLVRRDLNYRSPYDRFVTVDVEAVPAGSDQLESRPHIPSGSHMEGGSMDRRSHMERVAVAELPPALDYLGRAVASEPDRKAVAILSVGLLALAGGLFWPRPDHGTAAAEHVGRGELPT